MGNQNSNCTYKRPEPIINDTPPTKPEDTQEAFHTLIKSGEHKRGDLKCIIDEKSEKLPRKPNYNDTNVTECALKRVAGPELNNLKENQIDEAYSKWQDMLDVKHMREARYLHDRYTTNIAPVREKFEATEKEPVCHDLQKILYTCYRKNPEKTLRCYDEARCYINCVNQTASKCFRLGPSHLRRQQYCRVEIEPFRQTPKPKEPKVIDGPPKEQVEENYLAFPSSPPSSTTQTNIKTHSASV